MAVFEILLVFLSFLRHFVFETISVWVRLKSWLSLQDLSNNNRVRLCWVPGHCDIKGNEETDRLAIMG
jgi:ribonuclease HI